MIEMRLLPLMPIFLLSALLSLGGCVSQIVSLKEQRKAWLGHRIEEVKEAVARTRTAGGYEGLSWEEKTYSLDNGNSVYVELIGRDCFMHWEVNPQGIIVGSRTEGKRCWMY
jgi:hypothetical protein